MAILTVLSMTCCNKLPMAELMPQEEERAERHFGIGMQLILNTSSMNNDSAFDHVRYVAIDHINKVKCLGVLGEHDPLLKVSFAALNLKAVDASMKVCDFTFRIRARVC